MTSGALHGLRILDLSRLFPGPLATQILADYGADVLKVEPTGEGDYLREMDPLVEGVSRFFANLNRNKKSLCLNLKHPDGVALLQDLVRGADILVESFRPGVMDRLGVGYEALRAINPRLIYCAITGYGQTGPMKDQAGHDLNYLALSGLLGQNRDRSGFPVIPGFQIADAGGGGLNGVLGILLALQARQATGQGQLVDVAMVDGLAGWLVYPWAYHQAGPQAPMPYLSGQIPCYAVYETADGGHIALGALEPKFWKNFCAHVARPDWLAHGHEPDPVTRERIFDEVGILFRQKTRDQWASELAPVDCCATPVLRLEELEANPQWLARSLVVPEPSGAAMPGALGFPVKLSATPARVRSPSPGMGEHTDAELAALGYPADRIRALRESGVIS